MAALLDAIDSLGMLLENYHLTNSANPQEQTKQTLTNDKQSTILQRISKLMDKDETLLLAKLSCIILKVWYQFNG